ncbi:hypothetical protein V8G54_007325 [Vigna mungo]|uniref:Uncharacterized protein n=1 Tax=Vigna mungo TaxID=3915 RepID=A0AAQ3P565_VIGMU
MHALPNKKLKFFKLREQVFGCPLNVFFKQVQLLSFEFGTQILDKFFHKGNKCFLVISRLFLESKGVNNIYNFDGRVINTLFLTTFGRRVCPNVYINCSFNNPLLIKKKKNI